MAHRILIVEDNDLNAEMLTRRLERRGFVVDVARDGREALDVVQRVPLDLVLMDLDLPDVDGCEMTRRLKEDPATAGIPVIALTAHALVDDRTRSLAAGCDDFETKPIELPRLLDKMNRLIAGRGAS